MYVSTFNVTEITDYVEKRMVYSSRGSIVFSFIHPSVHNVQFAYETGFMDILKRTSSSRCLNS